MKEILYEWIYWSVATTSTLLLVLTGIFGLTIIYKLCEITHYYLLLLFPFLVMFVFLAVVLRYLIDLLPCY